MPRGPSLLPADKTGRVVDRLAGLEQVIPPQAIQQALDATGRVNQRACTSTYEVICWVVLAMGLVTDVPIRQVFKHARRLREGEASPHRSSLCVARQRLGVAPVRHLFTQTVRRVAQPTTPGASYPGLRLMGLDGTVLDVPDPPAKAAAFGRPSAGPRGEGAFPQIRKLSLVELGTHVEVAFVVKSSACGEQAMVAGLWRHLTPEMLLIWDRGFISSELWSQATSRGVNLLARGASHLVVRPIWKLADGSYLSKLYRNDYDRQKDRDGIVVRVIRSTLDDPQRVGHGEEPVLITDLLDEQCYPALELIPLYHERGEEELVFDAQKTPQDPRRATKPASLRSATPAGVIPEIYALSLGHLVIRSVMFAAAETRHLDRDRQSFSGCFQILKGRLPGCDSSTPQSFEQWYRGWLGEMQGERTDERRNRINPRVMEQKMSKWQKKRPEHRHLLPLKKTFMESVVMIR